MKVEWVQDGTKKVCEVDLSPEKYWFYLQKQKHTNKQTTKNNPRNQP
jgi:hypothetical protein